MSFEDYLGPLFWGFIALLPVVRISLSRSQLLRGRTRWASLAAARVPLFLGLTASAASLSGNIHSVFGILAVGALLGPWLVWFLFRRRFLRETHQGYVLPTRAQGFAGASLCGLVLAIQVVAGSVAHADEASDACAYVSRAVGTFKDGLFRETRDAFEDEGKIYRGCTVIVVGDYKKLRGRRSPADRLEEAAAKAGWKLDREAGGPDGTSYRISRGKAFCLVTEFRDGGDRSDPKYSPSPLFLITAQCAKTD